MQHLIQLSKKEIILNRHESIPNPTGIDTNLYFVKSGSLIVCIENETEEHVLRLGYTGNLIVALDSFISGKQSKLTIKAIKKSVLGVITKSQIDTFKKTNENSQMWTRTLENIVLQQFEREIDLLTSSPIERYQRVLKRSPKLFQEIPLQYIANYLRMSPETLSRLRKS
ncbi:MAG: Crp/Fnr family transcriptional regulator [Leadbetterella sp.]